MKRIFIGLILFIFLVSCEKNNFGNEKEIKLSSGKTLKVLIEKKETSNNEKVFVVEYQNDERVLKEENVEKEVLEIWKKVENEANQTDSTEGIIKASYFIGKDKETNESQYEIFLFNAEKIENGTWQIEKVN